MTYTSLPFSAAKGHLTLGKQLLDSLLISHGEDSSEAADLTADAQAPHPGVTSLDLEHWLYGGRNPRPNQGQRFFAIHGKLFFPGSEVEPTSRPDGLIIAPGQGNQIRLVVRQPNPELLAVQLGLIEGEWSRGKSSLRIPVMEGNTGLEEFLQSRDYTKGDPVRLVHCISPGNLRNLMGDQGRQELSRLAEHSISLASYADRPDTPRHVLGLRKSLGTEGITGTWFEAKRRMPGYRPQLDLFLLDESQDTQGREIAHLLAFFNPDTMRGEISYLGPLRDSSATDHQSQLTCLLVEAADRLERLGVKIIEIPCPPEPDLMNRLFEPPAGHQITREIVWEKVF